MSETIWSALLAVAVVEAIVLAVCLPFLGSGRARTANRLLACLLLDLTIDLGWYLLLVTGNAARFPHFVGLPTPFLVAPLYYLYAGYALSPDFRLRSYHALHAIPALVVAARTWPLYTATAAQKVAYIESLPGVHTVAPLDLLPLVAHLIQILVYVAVVDRLAARRRSSLANTGAPGEIDRVIFIRLVNFSFLLFVIVGSVIYGYIFVTHRATLEMDYVLLLTMCIVVSAIAFSAVTQPRSLVISLGEALTARGSRVSDTVLDQVHAELLGFMERERPFLQRNLKIGELARQMAVPQHHISQVLNAVIHANFNDFINQYRVREARKRLAADKAGAYTYSAIAADVGFTSRASFYRAFKRVTGTTPSEYVRHERSH